MKNSIYNIMFLLFVLSAGAYDIEIGESGPLGERAVRSAVEDVDLSSAADSIQKMYISQGYLMCEVRINKDSFNDNTQVLSIDIFSGPLARITKYIITGNVVELPELYLRRGGVFIQDDLNRDMEKIARAHENHGYPFVRVEIENLKIGPAIDDSFPVTISLNVIPGDSVLMGGVFIPGEHKTKEYVIERRMMMDLPELYSAERLGKGIERLDDLDYLSVNSDVDLMLDESGLWLYKIDLKEKHSVLVDGVLGYQKDQGFVGSIDASFSNMWGTGRNLDLRWDSQPGKYRKVGFQFHEPWLLGGDGDADLGAEYYSRDSTYVEREFDIEYNLPLRFDSHVAFGMSYRTVSPDSVGQNIYNIPESQEYKFSLGANISRLKPKYNPTHGANFEVKLMPSYIIRQGPDELFDELTREEPLLRSEANFELARKLFGVHILFIGFHGRSALSGGHLPLSDQYYLGGWNSLRGYREENFSAEHLGWANVEWRVIIGREAQIFAFLDNGFLRPSGEEYEHYLGYGLGLRIPTAIGRWSVAYGLSEDASLSSGLLHVALTTSF